MSIISELVDKLKKYAAEYNLPPFGREVEGTSELLLEAADTIEALSAKLSAANMELLDRYYAEERKLIDEDKLIEDLIKCRGLGRKSCEIIAELIKNQPKIIGLASCNKRSDRYYGGGWIACEDRLPEEHKLYDITFKNSAGIHSDSAIYNPYLKRWLWDADETELVENKVLAWAEKREPYRP